MNCEATSTTTVKLSAAELYEQEHLMYTRLNAPIVEKAAVRRRSVVPDLLYAKAEQATRLPSSRTGITYEGVKYNMDVKFTNQLRNCAPSKIEGYGAYEWTNPSKLRRIPPLPLDLFNMIKEKQKRASPTTSSSSGGSATATAPDEARPQNMEDIEALCRRTTDSQMDDWATWSKLGLTPKKLGAPYSLWQTMSATSKKFDSQQREDWGGKLKYTTTP